MTDKNIKKPIRAFNARIGHSTFRVDAATESSARKKAMKSWLTDGTVSREIRETRKANKDADAAKFRISQA